MPTLTTPDTHQPGVNQRERRTFPAIEIRASTDNGKPVIRGYAAVYNRRSQDLGGFYEVILPGAFERALVGQDDVRALVEHDPAKILGWTGNKTLRLFDEAEGLRIENDPPDTSFAKDIVESIRRGDVDSMSFAFVALDDALDVDDDGTWVRYVKRAQLFDVSPVTYPAYVDTSVAVRSIKQRVKEMEWSPDAETRSRLQRVEQLVRSSEPPQRS